jgi:hypothetical protein
MAHVDRLEKFWNYPPEPYRIDFEAGHAEYWRQQAADLKQDCESLKEQLDNRPVDIASVAISAVAGVCLGCVMTWMYFAK